MMMRVISIRQRLGIKKHIEGIEHMTMVRARHKNSMVRTVGRTEDDVVY